MTGRRIVAVVPAFDEEAAIGAVVSEIAELDPAIDVVVVDDGSSDGTADAAARAGATVVRLPFNVFARVISAARVNLNLTRRAHATVDGSSTCRPFELASAGAAIVSNPHAGLERWFEPGSELLVVEDAEGALEAYRALLDDPAEAEAMGARARERVLDEHTYAHRARQVLRLLDLEAAVHG